MRNKVVLITSRFGDVSDFFWLWLQSASLNNNFDFLVLTDLDFDYKSDNIKFFKFKSFNDFIDKVDYKLGYKTGITTPFKTADLRPAYSYLFSDIIKQNYQICHNDNGKYDFWGYTDTDMILGNLSHFIDDEVLDNCDVFQSWGHFTLIRNNERFNSLFCKPYRAYSLKNSLRLPENCMVEEGPFMLQLKAEGAVIDSKVSRIADIKRNKFEFTVDGKNYENQRFIYHNGEIRRIAIKGNEVYVNDEFMYIHFMKRIIKKIPKECCDLVLTENGFFPYDATTAFLDSFSKEAFNNWEQFTCVSKDIRYKEVSVLHKLLHLNNWLYKRRNRIIEREKRELISEYYGL